MRDEKGPWFVIQLLIVFCIIGPYRAGTLAARRSAFTQRRFMRSERDSQGHRARGERAREV